MTDRIITRDELNRHLWGAADILRGYVDSGEFRNHIFALLFLKRLSDVFDERRQEIIRDWIGEGRTRAEAEQVADDPDEYGDGSFFIPKEARWPELMAVGENRAEAIDTALAAIEEQNGRYLEGVLDRVHFNDARRFGEPDQMDAFMQRLLTHFSEIPLGNRNLSEPDVLGNAYEYLIERFAESAGKKGGEFYTPREVVKLIVELLRPTEGMRLNDPTGGSGGMLIECGRHVEDHDGNPKNLTLTAQEKNIDTWAICKLNMLLHNYPDADIRPGDTIRSPKFLDGGRLRKFDRVIANPPFSLKDWGHEDAAKDAHHRFDRGLPPRTKGDMAFLQHMVETCSDAGMVGVVMPHGVLFRGGAEYKIRRALLEEDLVEAVIGLPAKLFFGTGIPASILILNKNKPEERRGKVLFIDASPEGFYRDGSNRNFLRIEDIMRIAAVFRAYAVPDKVVAEKNAIRDEWTRATRKHWTRQLDRASDNQTLSDKVNADADRRYDEIQLGSDAVWQWLNKENPAARTSLEKFAAVVPLEEIAGENDFNLNISRYVDSSDPPPQLDVAEELKKLRELEIARNQAEDKMNQLLKELGYEA